MTCVIFGSSGMKYSDLVSFAEARKKMTDTFNADRGIGGGRHSYIANITMRLHDELPDVIPENNTQRIQVCEDMAEKLMKLIFDS